MVKHISALTRTVILVLSIVIVNDGRGTDGQLLLRVLVYPSIIQDANVLEVTGETESAAARVTGSAAVGHHSD